MAMRTPPSWLQAGSHTAQNDRLNNGIQSAPVTDAIQVRSGVKPSSGLGGLAVSQNGTPNMSVNVAAGQCIIQGTLSALQGAYAATNDGTVNLAIGASDPTNPRRDLVVVTVRDAAFSGANNDVILQVVQGTPAGSPVDPATPANSLVLARVAVAANATSITNANITDLRAFTAALNAPIVCNSASRPSNPYIGMPIYETDTNRALFYDGANWKQAKPALSEFENSLTTNSVNTSGTTELVLATLPAFTPDGATEIELSFNWYNIVLTVATDIFIVRLYDGPTAGSGTLLQEFLLAPATNTGGGYTRWRGTPSNASHTYTARIVRSSGTGVASVAASSTRPATLASRPVLV